MVDLSGLDNTIHLGVVEPLILQSDNFPLARTSPQHGGSASCKIDSGIILMIIVNIFQLPRSELDETLKRLQQHKGVTGVIVVNGSLGWKIFESLG